MRLLTRSDFDGLGCAVLLKELNLIDEIKFVHPKDVQDGKIAVNSNDILANVPYVKGCGFWFDHHSSEEERNAYGFFKGTSDPRAPSATRVIFHYFGGKRRFSNTRFVDLANAIDKTDRGDLKIDEILNPSGWVIISFIMDPRTGLGRYKDYRISNYQLMMDMINYCGKKSIADILKIEDVKERVDRYFFQEQTFKKMIQDNTVIHGNIILLDLRNQEEIYTGNRFIIYSLYPDQNVSIQVMWGLNKQNIVITCGHSIINKTCIVNIGSLMLKYGGGGHAHVGTCQIPINDSDIVLEELIKTLNF